MSTAPRISPMPAVEPLELFYVTDGSLLTAESWWQSHRYYQHRQNLHYQSLHQSGIVRGLGVRTIPAPESVPSVLRDGRWIEIQPGIAIDLVGNPIVVEQPLSFRITSEVINQPVTVYVALAYVDPKTKHWANLPASVVKEDFRINERTTPPDPHEVELCQIVLTNNTSALQDAADVFNPVAHEIDLRDRQQVKKRAQYPVQVGVIDGAIASSSGASPFGDRLTALLTSTEGLYPPLAGATPVMSISLAGSRSRNAITSAESPPERRLGAASPGQVPEITLLVLSYARALSLTEAEIERLQTYLARGSTLLIEYADNDQSLSYLGDLYDVQAELQSAIDDLQTAQSGTELASIRDDLIAEKRACETAIQEQRAAIEDPIHQWGQPSLPADQSAFTQYPFLFDALPHLPTGPIELTTWEGIILVLGPLSAAWKPQQFDSPLPRPTLRCAQELGINILYQASLRQRMIQAQHPVPGNQYPGGGDRL